MIAADTSSLVAYLSGEGGDDIEKLEAILTSGDLVLPPVVVTEILSDPAAKEALDSEISQLETLPIRDGYWIRAAHSRRALQENGLKARIADTLIAQSCIDHDVPLITRDRDFRHFSERCGLRLA